MQPNIVDFTDIMAGWLNVEIYDPRYEQIRKMRVSYVQPFFEDMLMACKFLLSDITGIYEVYLDQEGFEGHFRFYKYRYDLFIFEVGEEQFEDELPRLEDDVFDVGKEIISYFDVSIKDFVEHIIFLIKLHTKEYNEGFVFSPADEFNINLLQEIEMLFKKDFIGGENIEEVSDT